jgi:hypothetical protein
VTLNYKLGVQDHAYVMNDSGSKVLIFGEDFAADIESMKEHLNRVKKFIWVSPESPLLCAADTFDYEQLIAAARVQKADSVVIAKGMKPFDRMVNELKGKVASIQVVGDCARFGPG